MSKLALTIDEAAEAMSISPATLYRIIKDDESFPVVNLGARCKRVPVADLQAWLTDKKTV